MASKKPAKKSKEVDWERIRRAYESDENATFTSVGDRLGVSRFKIARRAAAEGWKKGAQRPVLEAAIEAATERAEKAEQEAKAAKADKAEKMSLKERTTPLPLPASLTGVEAPPEVEGLEDIEDAVEYLPASMMPKKEEGAGDVILRAQANAVRRQLKIGQEMQRLGVRAARRINAVLIDVNQLQQIGIDSPEAQEVLAMSQWNARQLTLINPDRETMAGLMKAASDLVERGILIERRALGMEGKSGGRSKVVGAPMDPDNGGPVITPTAMEAVERLDATAAWKMREMLEEHIKDRRRADIEAQKKETRR